MNGYGNRELVVGILGALWDQNRSGGDTTIHKQAHRQVGGG